MIGKKIGGFVLKHKLGEGGMAEVWYAENEIGKSVAVKILNNDLAHNAQIVERFKNEAVIMVKLDHPNIRQVYDYVEIDGRPAMLMEYLDGDDLKAFMNSGRKFSESELENWWNQMASALNYTHSKGIVHRDIKPSNIFIDSKGDVRLLDFGIAKIKEGITMTQTGAMMGTLMYMSPEQVCDSKHIDYRTDVYSLAVTFVHLLSGRTPYDTNSYDDYTIRKGIVEQPLDMTGVPASWRQFLEPYLAKDPQRRPALVPLGGKQATVAANSVVNNNVYYRNEETFVENAKPSTVNNLAHKPEKEKKSRKGLWIGLVSALIFTLICVGAALWTIRDNSSGKIGTEPSNTINVPEYVDLGLPSGTKWATYNVGASKPEEYGNYYAWGETNTKSIYTKDNYTYSSNLTTLPASADAATANWGKGWSMPTKEQFDELIYNCKWEWVSKNGVYGYKVIGNNGKYIFLPAAGRSLWSNLLNVGDQGYYWSGSLDKKNSGNPYHLYFVSSGLDLDDTFGSSGYSIRPVYASIQVDNRITNPSAESQTFEDAAHFPSGNDSKSEKVDKEPTSISRTEGRLNFGRQVGGSGSGGGSGSIGDLNGRIVVKVEPDNKDNLTGMVKLEITVNEKGNVETVKVIQSNCSECTPLAIETVKKWKYEPKPGSGIEKGIVRFEFLK